MKTYQGIGLMSGTSMDGLDMVCCNFEELGEDRYGFEIVAGETVPFGQQWKDRLTEVARQDALVFAKTNVFFGRWLGEQTRGFIQRNGLKPEFVASHGQTIFHHPEVQFTCQIGDGESMVSYLDCPLVTNFRNKNIAMGGQAAPLVPIGDRFLFHGYDLYINLGGIANLTYKGAAFDICMCNLLLNMQCRLFFDKDYDEDGLIAASGKLNQDLLADLDALEFYRLPPPKSLGWKWAVEHILPLLQQHQLSPEDNLRTLVEHTAIQIAKAAKRLKIEPGSKALMTGGGYHNHFLMQQIMHHFEPLGIEVDQSVDKGTVDFKEAIIFAFLGLRLLTGKSNILKDASGGPFDMLGGSVHLPARAGNFFKLRVKN